MTTKIYSISDTQSRIQVDGVDVATLDKTAGLKVTEGFGCNGKNAQTEVTVNAACTDLSTAVALINQLRAALIANGICI